MARMLVGGVMLAGVPLGRMLMGAAAAAAGAGHVSKLLSVKIAHFESSLVSETTIGSTAHPHFLAAKSKQHEPVANNKVKLSFELIRKLIDQDTSAESQKLTCSPQLYPAFAWWIHHLRSSRVPERRPCAIGKNDPTNHLHRSFRNQRESRTVASYQGPWLTRKSAFYRLKRADSRHGLTLDAERARRERGGKISPQTRRRSAAPCARSPGTPKASFLHRA